MTKSARALFSNLIDYAGLYPPAGLPLSEVLECYRRYRTSGEHWILNRLVLPWSKLTEAPLEEGWRVTLLSDDEPVSLPEQVETLEAKGVPDWQAKAPLPLYCEAPIERVEGAFAKIRTGGLTPDAIPPAAEIAAFLHAAAERRIPFKATAGLHHPIRGEYPLTYAADAPRAVMHGFVNVFVAAAFAWLGNPPFMLAEILEETDPRSFDFRDDELCWRGRGVGTSQIKAARLEFAHSFGSCSFEEPVAGLRELGLLS